MTTTQLPPIDVEPVSVEHVQEVLDTQRRAFIAEGPPTAEVRRNRIDRFHAAILENADEFAAALSADFGNRGPVPSLSYDILGAVEDTVDVHAHLEEWMADRPVEGSAEKGLPSFVQVRPKGVVGIIGTWNFPLSLVVEPVIEALGAGNRVIVKFSKQTPRTGQLFARAVASRLSEDEIYVVHGGQVSGSAFSRLAWDHLFFTGSPEVGAKVGAAAVANLVPVTLELGGKNPIIVGPDADISIASERVAAARLMNNGQLCLSPDYVFVPRPKVGDFVAGVRAAWRASYPTFLGNPDVISEVDDGNYQRVIGYLEDARAKGATVDLVVPDDELSRVPDRATRYIPPTILQGVTEDMAIADEEVFGPLLTVYPYDDYHEAIDYLNSKPHPLASFWYGADTPEFREFLRLTTSGGTTRNDMALHWSAGGAPFGGVGMSGMGAYHGKVGFDELSHLRTVTQSDLPFSPAVLGAPPYAEGSVDQLHAGIQQALAFHLANLGEAPTV